MTYVTADGRSTTVDVPVGDSVMDGALDHNIPGIIGQCGGGLNCTTCHCYVALAWRSRLPPPHPDEREMLDYALDRRAGSRLSCQIRITEALDGLEVSIPERQLP